jgi:fructose-1-phosphate kinase PfkB-like protein
VTCVSRDQPVEVRVPIESPHGVHHPLLQECQPGDVVSCDGSVPGGVPATVWADLVSAPWGADVTVVLDVQGEAMLRALTAGPVALATSNETEIAALPGVDPTGPDPVADASRSLAGSGVTHPAVTLGAAGAAFLQGGHVHRAACPVERRAVAVGAGDAFLAGACAAILAGRGETADLVSAGLVAAAAQGAGLTGGVPMSGVKPRRGFGAGRSGGV